MMLRKVMMSRRMIKYGVGGVRTSYPLGFRKPPPRKQQTPHKPYNVRAQNDQNQHVRCRTHMGASDPVSRRHSQNPVTLLPCSTLNTHMSRAPGEERRWG